MELQAAGRAEQQKDLEGFANIYLVRMFLMVVKVTNYDIGLQMMRGRPDMYLLSDKSWNLTNEVNQYFSSQQ